MKEIFLAIQRRLADTVPTLRYIDKDWQQLTDPHPPVQWPCCLIDLDNVDYTQLGGRGRMAEAQITLTVADELLKRSSGQAPSKGEAYDTLDVVAAVRDTLHGWRVPGTTQDLAITNIAKQYREKGHVVYSLTFATAWTELDNPATTAPARPSVTVRLAH